MGFEAPWGVPEGTGLKKTAPLDGALLPLKPLSGRPGRLTGRGARGLYEKPTAGRRRKKAAAVKRHEKRVGSMQLPKKMY